MNPLDSLVTLAGVLACAGLLTLAVKMWRDLRHVETRQELIDHPQTCKLCHQGVMCGEEAARRAVYAELVQHNPFAMKLWDTDLEHRARSVAYVQFRIDGVAR